jgi:DNA-binding XRE family transcriptional regulator
MNLGTTLHKLQRQANFNITQLANYVGLSRSTVRRVLSHRTDRDGWYKPSYNTVSSIAKSLATTSDDIVQRKLHIHILS